MTHFDYSVQEFLRDCKQSKDTLWPQLPSFIDTDLTTRENSERVRRLEEKFANLNSRIQFLESNWKRDVIGSTVVPSDEERMKLYRLLLRAESLVNNLSLENQNLRSQVESLSDARSRRKTSEGSDDHNRRKPHKVNTPGSGRGVTWADEQNLPNSQNVRVASSTLNPNTIPQLVPTPTQLRRVNSTSSTKAVVQKPMVRFKETEDTIQITPEPFVEEDIEQEEPPQVYLQVPPPISKTSLQSQSQPYIPTQEPVEELQKANSVGNDYKSALKRRTEPDLDRPTKQPKKSSPSVRVLYPTGYDPQKRRYSVSSESFTPEQFRDVKLKIIPKSDEIKARIRSTVQSNVLFKHLDDEELDEVVDAMDEKEFDPHTVVIKQGAFVDENHMYLINKGELEVLYGDEVVATLTTGNAFGEIALMYGCPRTATVRTRIQCSLWVLDRNTFRRILMEESMRRRKLYESVLAKVPIFKGLLPYERSKVADALESVSFKDKEVIIQQGSTDTDKFYIIEKGQVVCSKKGADDNLEVEALRLKAGDYFGELALLRNEPRQATVTAVGPVKCLTIGFEHFNQVMGPCEDILRRNMGIYKSYEELVSSLQKPEGPRSPDSPDLEVAFNDLPDSREELVKYIIQNDDEYVFNLSQTEGYYNAITEHRQALSMTEEQINDIFSNVKEILSVHKLFNKRLRALENEEDPELGDLFAGFSTSLSVYEQFVSDYPKSLKTRLECSQVTEFSDFLMACHKEAGESLDTLLEQIYTRVAQIVVLLQALVSATEAAHSDKNSLGITLRKIQNHASNIKNIKLATSVVQ